MLATLIPTILMTALGIVLLAVGSQSLNLNLVAGVLLLAFCTTSLTGYILGSIFVYRGASLARVQNDFVNSVSHELRTPLTSIRMFIETLRDGRVEEPEERRRCLDLIFTEVQRLEGLVGRIIDLSKYEAARRTLVFEPVPVQEIFDEVVKAFDAATLSDPNPVEVEVTPSDLKVRADRSSLSVAIGNLVMNAYKYSRPGPARIRMAARVASERWLEVVIQDDGPGIPRHERKRVFEEFERGAHAINKRTPGSGLGLAIVKAVVTSHGGQVDLRSRSGKGTEVRLRLRRAA